MRLPFCVNIEQMALYLKLSGDDNPLHTDDNFARQYQFRERVVYGGILLAAVSRLLGTQVPGPACIWHSLSMNFRKPFYIGEPAEVVATVIYSNSELRVLKMKIEIFRGTECIADGRVQAGLPQANEP